MDGVKRSVFDIMGQRNLNMAKVRQNILDLPAVDVELDKQVEIDAHYQGYLDRQANDIETFNKDEQIAIPDEIDYSSMCGLSNEIRFKLEKIRPGTIGQASRIDGMTPAAILIILSHLKRRKLRSLA